MMSSRSSQGCCCLSHFNKDNGRFPLSGPDRSLPGSWSYSVLSPREAVRSPGSASLEQDTPKLQPIFNISMPELRDFLRSYEAAMAAGIRADALRPRWDFTGAFYFVGTVVSTIGKFGMTTPATVAGKSVPHNLWPIRVCWDYPFLQSVPGAYISLLAFIMKACHERQLRRSGLLPPNFRRGSAISEVDSLAGWKPSVYHVMLILGIFAFTLACCASAMYTAVEGWNYIDSLYYCLSHSAPLAWRFGKQSKCSVSNQGLYRFGNFMFILMGVSCIYSLFNVISIVIKQVLNWLLKKFGCRCCSKCHKSSARLGRRNAITPGSRFRRHNISVETDGQYDSDTEGRRLSGEMISMKELTASNKVSLAILQKQLSEMANGYPRNVSMNSRQNGFSAGIGALAIMNNRLVETSDSR
uniref:Potassium channel domain-containing protein n=1 Tax=Gopherus evgoodei TaxID=1825980 RepID=A0A8C4VDG4_9SAUR